MSANMQHIFPIFSLCFALGPLLTWAAVPQSRIISGELSKPQQFPYQAGLYLYKEQKDDWCGGALISNRWVLTAAVCTYDLGKGLDLYLGTWNRLDKSEKGQQVIFIINNEKNIILHTNFTAVEAVQWNDLSLVRIPAPIQFNEYIQPVQLPIIQENQPDYADEFAVTSGWGLVKKDDKEYTDKLRWVPGLVVTNGRCNDLWNGRVLAINICILRGGSATCTGDTGGPLVLEDTNILIGITTFNQATCSTFWPMVFSRITSNLEWIRDQTGIVG